jgi:mannonate dehydratase
MEQTWRWFGEQDPISLDHIRQAGATGVVTALHHIASGQPWRPEEIADRKAVLAAAGLKWSVCESIPVPDAIKLGGAGSRAAIDAWKISLAGLGRAGVAVVCYNFMPVVDWTRTDLAWRLPSGRALRFDLVDFIGYDVFVLERADAASNYDPRLVATARKRISAKTEAEISLLERNVIAGLPGGAEAQTRGSIARRIENFTGLSNDEMHENLAAFLREVVPVAEEVGVRLAIHPDDPPRSLFGLPRVVSTAEDARRILRAVDHEANGLTLCAGSYGSRADNNVVAMAREFAPRIHFAHLRNVALEPDGSFYEAEHLDGVVDMVALVEILLKEERAARAEGRRADIPMRPDHGHLLADDVAKRTNPGYSYIGRLKGLAELRGVMRALDARISA